MRPMEATVAALDPEMAPKTTQEATVTRPRLPRTPPKRAMQHLTSRSAMALLPRSSPANKKKGTGERVEEATAPDLHWGTKLVGTVVKKMRAAMEPARKQR